MLPIYIEQTIIEYVQTVVVFIKYVEFNHLAHYYYKNDFM